MLYLSKHPNMVFRSTVYAAFLLVTVIPYAFICILGVLLPRRQWRYRLTMAWPRLAIWGARVICGIRYRVIGMENLPDGPAILMSKHQSAWETLFFPSFMRREVCYVYKKELHLVPFFGWGLALLKMIAIDRKRSSDAVSQLLKRGTECLAQGRWIILFPEGTRVVPGQVMKYKSGGARLAIRSGVPIIPIALNAGLFWRKNSFIKQPGLVTVSVGEPISPHGLKVDELNTKVQNWIENEMIQLSKL